jgi:hypothetical protein
MAEGSETPNGGQGLGPEGRPRRGEGDLLAERRARRAAESGEVALLRRAEAAEATVETLERHVASLQQRLREVEAERVRTDQLLDVERSAVLEREHELQRVKQREYAEQQLRLEAEERAAELTAVGARVDRESRERIERLDVRLSASESGARELGQQLETLQRRLAEAEREARSTPPRTDSEQALQARLAELERRAQEIQQGLADERAARERSEALLQSMREGHLRMELLLAEMKDLVAHVTDALAAAERERLLSSAPQLARPPAPPTPPGRAGTPPPVALDTQGAEMADALAAAVERLRARADAAAEPMPEPHHAVGDAHGAVTGAPAAESSAPAAAPDPPPAPHRHSMTLVGWFKYMRKQRTGA